MSTSDSGDEALKVKAVINKSDFRLNISNKSAIISSIVILAGIVFGVILYSLSDKSLVLELKEDFVGFVLNLKNKNNPEIFAGLFFQNVIYCLIMIIFSLCVYGTPAVLLISFIKAMGLGLLTTCIYDSFLLKGVEYCLLVFFPGKVFLIFAMILLTQNSYINSNLITVSFKGNSERGGSLKKFALRTLVIIVIITMSNILDCLTSVLFSSLFEFA